MSPVNSIFRARIHASTARRAAIDLHLRATAEAGVGEAAYRYLGIGQDDAALQPSPVASRWKPADRRSRRRTFNLLQTGTFANATGLAGTALSSRVEMGKIECGVIQRPIGLDAGFVVIASVYSAGERRACPCQR